ncbi:MAG: fatty acid desaturase, partial [Candidatus Binatia bacterium]|nr:fatty acid desaturase [Candidatus Binatia bacterium]
MPIAASNNSFWSLIHEAIHELFNPSLHVNAAVARFLLVLFGSPFRLLRLSHLMHHTFNRTPQEATGVYDPEGTSKTRARIGYYGQILGGLYLLEALSPLPFYLPRRLLGCIEQSVAKRSSLNGWLV